MTSKILFIVCLLISSIAAAQKAPSYIKSLPNGEISVNGSLENGEIINDLSWAWNSSVACFPATQQKSFNGNHVLYETALPKRAIMVITLTPKNANSKMSLYGYSVGTNSKAVVPNLSSCVSCEADNNQMGKANNNKRSIRLNATTNPYKVYFGVVGENGLQKGDYTLTIKLEGGEETQADQKPVPLPKKVKAIPNGAINIDGSLDNGVIIHDLSWAWNSSNACFPATQQKSFNGNHVLYETQLPPHAILEITLTPKNRDSKMSLYGYQVGTTSNYVVPNLPRCVSCEADNNIMGKATSNARTITFNAIKNPYKVVFGVVGENELTTGDFTISVKMKGGENKPLASQEKVVVKSCRAPEKGKALAYKDDIKNGVFISDLSWAWNSSVACFPETQKLNYTGKHILFETSIPRYSTMTVTLIPTNPKAKLSLYGYQIGTNSNYVVPNLPRCVSCEADNNQMGKAKNNRRSITFTAINNPYKIMLGVAGVNGLTEGEFVIQIAIKAR